MKTKILTLTGLVLCLAFSVMAQTDRMKDEKMTKNAAPEQMLMQMERKAWKALEEKRYDDFANMLTDDYQGIYADERHDKTVELAGLKQLTFKDVVLSDMKVQFADKDAVIVTSIVKGAATLPDGTTINTAGRTTTVWVKRGKNWMIIYHSDFPVKSAGNMDKMDKM